MAPQEKIARLEAELIRQKQLTEFFEQGNIYVSGCNFDDKERMKPKKINYALN